MFTDEQREKLRNRLRRIEGQIAGISRMIENDRYCVDILNQTSAVVSAIRNVENLVMENHLSTCVVDAIRSGDPEEQRLKTDEIMEVFGKYRK